MRITKNQLKQIIKEELSGVLAEVEGYGDMSSNDIVDRMLQIQSAQWGGQKSAALNMELEDLKAELKSRPPAPPSFQDMLDKEFPKLTGDKARAVDNLRREKGQYSFSGPDTEIKDFSITDPEDPGFGNPRDANLPDFPDAPMDWESQAMRYSQHQAGVPINYSQTAKDAYPEGRPKDGLSGPLSGDDQGPHPAYAGDEDVRSQYIKENRRRKVRKVRRK